MCDMSYFNFYQHRLPAILRQVKRIKRTCTSPKFYAVAVGRRVGIFRSWPSAKVQIDGIANAKYQRFDTHQEALAYMTQTRKEIPIPLQDYTPVRASAKRAVVYVDGSCWRNGMKDATAGLGVYWPSSPHLNISQRLDGRQTNIRAELWAAIIALQAAKEQGIEHLIIYTDSHFVIQTATIWLPKWKRNGWIASSGEPVKNQSDLIALDEAIVAIEKVTWLPVSAHTGVPGNEKADKLANQAIAEYFKSNITVNKVDNKNSNNSPEPPPAPLSDT